MAINKWRYVDYLDDGVSAYQCLKCYETWTSREPAGYFKVERIDKPDGCITDADGTRYDYIETGIYVPIYNYCPFCGTKWDGPERENSDEFGPRKTRIQEAIKRRDDARWKMTYEERQAFDLEEQRRRRPRFHWIIEKQYHLGVFRPLPSEPQPNGWELVTRLDPREYSAREALDYMRRHRAMDLGDHAEDIANGEAIYFHRIRAGKPDGNCHSYYH